MSPSSIALYFASSSPDPVQPAPCLERNPRQPQQQRRRGLEHAVLKDVLCEVVVGHLDWQRQPSAVCDLIAEPEASAEFDTALFTMHIASEQAAVDRPLCVRREADRCVAQLRACIRRATARSRRGGCEATIIDFRRASGKHGG
jgi:hypothetical protein